MWGLVVVPVVFCRAPFAPVHLPQPVLGALRGRFPDGWARGKLCNVTAAPYLARGDNRSDDTAAIQAAIDACGDRGDGGGTVLLPFRGAGTSSFVTGALWLRSNLTLRIEPGAVLIGTNDWSGFPLVYTRSGCTMMHAHAALINAGRCRKMKEPPVGWDDCAEWQTVENLVIEGGGAGQRQRRPVVATVPADLP